ncbi:MAG: hypothetical protein QM760_02530 [Nibricoccus sp.]
MNKNPEFRIINHAGTSCLSSDLYFGSKRIAPGFPSAHTMQAPAISTLVAHKAR